MNDESHRSRRAQELTHECMLRFSRLLPSDEQDDAMQLARIVAENSATFTRMASDVRWQSGPLTGVAATSARELYERSRSSGNRLHDIETIRSRLGELRRLVDVDPPTLLKATSALDAAENLIESNPRLVTVSKRDLEVHPTDEPPD